LPAGTTTISEFAVAVVAILIAISLQISCSETAAFVIAPTAFIEVACIFTVFADFTGSIIAAIIIGIIAAEITVNQVTKVTANAIKQNL